ncbi:MAG: glutathione synthase [Granulosicoccaceae bacterium]
MTLKIGIVMDPIESITPYKDTTLAMMLAAQARGWQIFYMQQHWLYFEQGKTFARMQAVQAHDNKDHWFDAEPSIDAPLADLDIVLMRKDPPFNMDYIYTTYLLERAAVEGVLVSNQPNALRDVNEKLFTTWFSEHCPPMLVTADAERIKAFVQQHKDVIVKPLDGMGGESIYRITESDPNINVILENMTRRDRHQIMAQRFIPEIVDGDKRILVVHGKPMPYALARVPAQGETRGNLAAGGRGVPVALSDSDREIAESIAPHLVERGLHFVGLDVIGSSLTEVNVTSPTCVRELDAHAASLAPEPANASGYVHGIADIYLDGLAALRNS